MDFYWIKKEHINSEIEDMVNSVGSDIQNLYVSGAKDRDIPRHCKNELLVEICEAVKTLNSIQRTVKEQKRRLEGFLKRQSINHPRLTEREKMDINH